MPASSAPRVPPFDFARDTFGYRNELVWEYAWDGITGQIRPRRASPRPTYAHRCFVMVRTVRQFADHARFDPELPPPDEAAGEALIRAVVRRGPRCVSRPNERVGIPGFGGLREFSRVWEPTLKRLCGGAWRSYALRSHWRMVFPFSRRHQAREVESLREGLRAGRLPIVHVVRFPELTINHGLLLFDAREEGDAVRFAAYDPNVPEAPAQLSFDRAKREFCLPENTYWAGGRVDAFETYRGWFY